MIGIVAAYEEQSRRRGRGPCTDERRGPAQGGHPRHSPRRARAARGGGALARQSGVLAKVQREATKHASDVTVKESKLESELDTLSSPRRGRSASSCQGQLTRVCTDSQAHGTSKRGAALVLAAKQRATTTAAQLEEIRRSFWWTRRR